MKNGQSFWRAGLSMALCMSGSLGALLTPVSTAGARDLTGRYASSPNKDWFNSLSSGKGPCCDLSDGYRVDDADWETHDGKYRVRIDGEWVDVEDDALLKQPNLAGKTMVWPMFKDGHPRVRCFIPGPMT